MKTYKDKISLNKNARGCYIIDTVKGCRGGSLYGGKGCYGDCYAKNIADRYRFDFASVVRREFQFVFGPLPWNDFLADLRTKWENNNNG